MDLLIKLYAPVVADAHVARDIPDVVLRKPIGPEHRRIVGWVGEQFGDRWASEAQVALGNRPVSVWVAIRQSELAGFACYDATARGYFGPIGVADAVRGQGVGSALLTACLQEMRAVGYGYAIVGGVGETGLFRQAAGAVEIAGSTPGLYGGRLSTR